MHEVMEWDARLNRKMKKDILHPVAYHSRNLKDYEKSYAITELERLAIIDALDKFLSLYT